MCRSRSNGEVKGCTSQEKETISNISSDIGAKKEGKPEGARGRTSAASSSSPSSGEECRSGTDQHPMRRKCLKRGRALTGAEPLLPTKVISTSSSITVQRHPADKPFPLHNVWSPSVKAQYSGSDLYCSQPASNQDDLPRPPLGIFSPYHRREPSLTACPLGPGH